MQEQPDGMLQALQADASLSNQALADRAWIARVRAAVRSSISPLGVPTLPDSDWYASTGVSFMTARSIDTTRTAVLADSLLPWDRLSVFTGTGLDFDFLIFPAAADSQPSVI